MLFIALCPLDSNICYVTERVMILRRYGDRLQRYICKVVTLGSKTNTTNAFIPCNHDTILLEKLNGDILIGGGIHFNATLRWLVHHRTGISSLPFLYRQKLSRVCSAKSDQRGGRAYFLFSIQSYEVAKHAHTMERTLLLQLSCLFS